MDGPNVNLKLYRDLVSHLEKNYACTTNSRSLHIVHNVYKIAHNKTWNDIHSFLRSLYYLFKDFFTRRADYTYFSQSTLFPLKFCSVRWLENKRVIERAITMLPNLRKYIAGVESNPPKSRNYKSISKALKNVFLEPKLHFMLSVINDLQDFLTGFQSDAPLMPFLHEDLQKVVRNIGTRFLSKMTFLLKNVPKNLLDLKDINIGFAAKALIEKLTLSKQLEFKEACRSYLRVLFEKLLQKCPLSNDVVKGASCLSPTILLESEKLKERSDLILTEYLAAGLILGKKPIL